MSTRVRPGESIEAEHGCRCIACGRDLGPDAVVRLVQVSISARGCFADHVVMSKAAGTDMEMTSGYLCSRCLRPVERIWEKMRGNILNTAKRTN